MIYCDTSLLVAALTAEAASGKVQAWLGSQDAGMLGISGWVVTEFSSALAIKLRAGELTMEQRAQVLTYWRRMMAENLVTVPVQPTSFELAARYIDRHDLGLRAGDALHLAIASQAGMALATLDRAMAKAAVAIGLEVREVAG
jgi:uncharacterized protein